jgi:hypothetical protein
MKINWNHLIAFIWACLISLLWLFTMYGCSGQYHYAKAVKKGVRCETITDTIELTRIDSVFINNEWVKIVTKYDTIIRYNEVFVPKTRYQIKTEYKLKRDTIELLKYQTKIEYKTIKAKYKFPWVALIICMILGLIIALLKTRR